MKESDIERIVKNVLGKTERAVVSVVSKGVGKGYDEKKLKERLSSHISDSKASLIAHKVIEESSGVSRKRTKKFEEYPERKDSVQNGGLKKPKLEPDEEKGSTTPVYNAAHDLKVKEIMAQAQKMIDERKRKMHLPVLSGTGNLILRPGEAQEYMQQALEKARRQEELKARIADRLPAALGSAGAAGKAKTLILDAEEKAVVDSTGKAVPMAQRTPTLKANLRAESRAAFKKPRKETPPATKPEEVIIFVDPRVSQKGAVRPRRQFAFHEKGEFELLANRQRAKAKLDRLQSEISEAAKKTGISSAVKLAMVAPKHSDTMDSEVPGIEWWDSIVFPDAMSYDDVLARGPDGGKALESVSTITRLVEHPIQLRPPTDPLQTQYLKVYLTKKEQKKLRRQNRKEALREKTEKIRLGLEPAPEPKVKISNLMRVLGTDAIQDPTKMEAHVREQMAKRLKKHEEANAARKLTKEQKASKKAKKMQEDTSLGIYVAVYRVKELSHHSKKFKVEMNAKQVNLTGCVVLHKDINIVVVEGGQKQQKFYKNLMLRRIKWSETAQTEDGGTKEGNRCELIWEGTAKQRYFGDFKFKNCPLEKQAREHFEKHGCPEYWDRAYTGTVMEQEEDSVL